jgi:streptogramin lyase
VGTSVSLFDFFSLIFPDLPGSGRKLPLWFFALIFVIPLAFAAQLNAQTAHFSGVQTPIPAKGLNAPYGVAVDGAGNVYIADSLNNRILKETFSAGSYNQSVISTSSLNGPLGIAVDGSGNVYIADSINNRVLKESPSAGAYTETVVASGLADPLAVAVDTSGNVYICGTGNSGNIADNPVYKETPSGGTYIQSIIVNLKVPTGIAVDGSGDVYIIDSFNNQILKETPSGASYTPGTVPTPGLQYMFGIAADPIGNLYITYAQGNGLNGKIARETVSGSTYLQTLYAGGLNNPEDVAVDPNGHVYVADAGTSRVLQVVNAGDFGSVNIGAASSSSTLVFTFDATTTIGTPSVLTQGATGLDFKDTGSGSCNSNGTAHTYIDGDSCTVNVIFTPKYPGVRYGAAVLRDGAGNVIATGYVQGTGVGPQVSFPEGVLSTLLTTTGTPNCIAADAAGNLYIGVNIAPYSASSKVIKESWNGSGFTESVVAGGFDQPLGLTVDGAGNVYIDDADYLQPWVATPTATGYSVSKLPAHTTGFRFSAIAVDSAGNLYLADELRGILKETRSNDGTYVESTIASDIFTSGIGVDKTGNLYFSGGNLLGGSAHAGLLKETYANGAYSLSTISNTQGAGIAIDADNNIYMYDTTDGLLVKESWTGASYVETTTSFPMLGRGLVLDPVGNVYAPTSLSTVGKLDMVTPPSLSFASTTYDTPSSDSPKTVTLANNGNASLILPIPSSESNPSHPSSFTISASGASACPSTTSNSSAPATLAANTSCDLVISFVPQAVGSVTGSLVFTDDALNASTPTYATQAIALSGTATQAKPTVTVFLPSTLSFLSDPSTLTATVSAANGSPTGSVTFYDGVTQLGTSPVNAGSASYTTSSLTVGQHPITAAYSGDSNFTTATSSALTEVIEDFTIAVASGSSSSASTSAGGQATYTLTIAPSGGAALAGAVTLAMSGGPSGATATFQPATVAAGSGSTNVTLNLKTPAAAAAIRATASVRPKSAPLALGALLCLGMLAFRRRVRRMAGTATLLLCLAGLAVMMGIGGCGGGPGSSGGGGGSTPQNYSLTVTASAGALAHSTTLTLTVQ